MKNYILLLVLIFIVQSCQNDNKNEIKRLQEENEMLKMQVNEEPINIDNPKFVWTVITYKTGIIEGDENGERLTNIKTQSSWTDIVEVANYDYTSKLRIQDEFEHKLRQKKSSFLHSIVKRETFDFNTYAEASEFRSKTINK